MGCCFGLLRSRRSMSVVTIRNESGLSLSAITVGASITALRLPDGTDVVLGYQDLEVYRRNPFYLGCSVGRVTNRTAGAQFTLDGKTYKLTANAPGNNHLHGGTVGFNKAVWVVEEQTATSVTFSHTSPDGDQGYPGELKAHARYSLCGTQDVVVEYWAETSAPTPVNMTNHSYFNLAGQGTIGEHMLTINADKYTPLGADLTATGKIAPVDNIIDFRTPHRVVERMSQAGERGYDHNYCLNAQPLLEGDDKLHLAATLKDPSSLRSLTVYTDQPCVQLYVGGYLDESEKGKDGRPIVQHAGLCLETQHHPNAANEPNFPSIILRPGERYYSKTVWRWRW